MKSSILGILLCCFLNCAQAQKTAYDYYDHIPNMPSAPCERKQPGPDEFSVRINKLMDELSTDLNARNKKAKEFMKSHEEQARQNAVANSGLVLTPEQMKIMQQKNKHMTAAQKKELADQVMQQNMNVSMGELESLKKDDKHVDRKSAENWAKAYSTELEGQREIDPEKAEADQKKNKEIMDLQLDIDDELQILHGGLSEFTERLTKLQQDADSAYVILRIKTDPIRAHMDTIQSQLAREKERCGCSMEQKSKEVFEEVNQLSELIQEYEYEYCLPLTPRYIDIMKDYKIFLLPQFARCDKIERLQEEMQFRQTGIRDPEFKPGTVALESLKNYVVLLSNIYKYKISDKPLTQAEKEALQTISD